MKLIKFIAAATLVVSASFASAGNNDVSAAGINEDLARVCPDWPYCRGVEIADSAVPADKDISEVDSTKYAVGVCPDWPYCRGVEIAEQATELQSQMQSALIRKAA
jgi:hypothetical protein